MNSRDGKVSCEINSPIENNGYFAGYFLIPGYGKSIMGQSGHGYDFMNYETSGAEVDFIAPKWIENDFFLEDLEGFSLGPEVKTAISFNIKPFYSSDKKSRKKAFVAKFAVISPKSKNKNNTYDQLCDVKLFYKLLYADSTGSVRVDYLNNLIPEYKFTLKISILNRAAKTIVADGQVFNEIKKSLNESSIGSNSFAFSAGLGVYPPKEIGTSQNAGELADHRLVGATPKYFLVSGFNSDTLHLEHPVYCASLRFPFRLYNDEKMMAYSNYKNTTNIFNSDYEILIIPISCENGVLTADVISNYSKLRLNDGVQRWSPFKKRITFKYRDAFIDFPLENWSAVFSRGKEYFEIYGYSDYEKYVSELLTISLQKVFREM
jgi:hypothetical protein